MQVSDRQYFLQGDEFLDVYDDTDTITRISEGNSLAAGGPEHLTVFTGTHTGHIQLTTEQRPDAPPLPGDDWETAVEVSVCSTSGGLWLADGDGDVLEEAGNFAMAGTGWYRVRVQARGRDEGEAAEGEAAAEGSAVETHFLSVWPSPPEPDVVHRANDTFGRAHYDPRRPPALPVEPGDPHALPAPRTYAGQETP
jgi:hypothetical protein